MPENRQTEEREELPLVNMHMLPAWLPKQKQRGKLRLQHTHREYDVMLCSGGVIPPYLCKTFFF